MKNKTILFICLLLVGNMLLINNKPSINEKLYISKYDVIEYDTLAFYVQESEDSENYTNAKTIPSKDDGYEFKKYECTDNSILTFYNSDWSIELSNLEKGVTKCKLYFDISTAKARDYILSQNTINEPISDFSSIAITNEGMFEAEDDYGTSYYYRGAVTNNYFYFAGYYWRIIRINGDGSIRLIYQGFNATSTGNDSKITSSSFNSTRNNNMYVGYMYTDGYVHGFEKSSTIKDVLDAWYDKNMKSYDNYIDINSGFCGDRNPSTTLGTSNGSGGTGTTPTYYGGAIRFLNNLGSWRGTQTPTFKCLSYLDFYTANLSSYGNKALSYPIGLITADEIVYAGGLAGKSNTSFYLWSGIGFWTMTPFWYNASSYAHMLSIYEDGTFGDHYVHTNYGVRPVINIKKNVTLTGSGTSTDPYVVS